MIEFDLVEHKPAAGPALTLAKVNFRPSPQEEFHSNIFRMQLYPTGIRLLIDGLGRLVTGGGRMVAPLPDASFPDEDPRDPYQRETFARNNDAEMVANIEAYWERKLKAADEGRPYPQHHRSTLNLQVGASSDDANENESSTVMFLTIVNAWFSNLSFRAHVGLRFTAVSGLSGATIDTAVLTFRSNATDSGAFVGDWYAEDAAAPGTFTTTNGDISGRTRTTATCEGDGGDFGNWSSGADETFSGPAPSIKGILQELADDYDPSAIVLLHIVDSLSTGERVFRAWDNSSGTAPKLDIDYTAAAVGFAYTQAVII